MREHVASIEMGDTPQKMREGFDAIMTGQLAGEPGEVGGVSGLYFGSGPCQAIWLHGGGYVFGSAKTHGFAAHTLASDLKGRVFVPDYALAPEQAWPAPLRDVKAILDDSPHPMAVVGDSAGGHLALQLALHHPELVETLVLFSPNTDRTGRSVTRRRNSASDIMNDHSTDDDLFRLAMPNMARNALSASPVNADLSGLPPTYICVGGAEVLLDDSLILAREAGLAGVRVKIDVLPGLSHMFWQWPDIYAQARFALETAAKFIRN